MRDRIVSLSAFSLLLLAGPVQAGQVEIISRIDPALVSDTAGGSASSMSADGRFVTFVSTAPNLLPGQTSSNILRKNVYLDDRQTGSRTLISRSSASAVTGGNGDSWQPVVSADGRFVAFQSLATDLVAGLSDTNDTIDLFLYDRIAGTLLLVSRSSASATTAAQGGPSLDAALSADGRYVAYDSRAVDLVPRQNDPAGLFSPNIFLFDRVMGTTTLVSHAPGQPTTEALSIWSEFPAISADGSWVAFLSESIELIPGLETNRFHVFLWQRTTGTVTLASRRNGSATAGVEVYPDPPSMSADGRVVAFVSADADVIPGQVKAGGEGGSDLFNVFVFDRLSGSTALVSRSHVSAQVPGNGPSTAPDLSTDGRFVTFTSQARDLVAGQTTPPSAYQNVFLRDLALDTTVIVSRSSTEPLVTANGTSSQGRISADGRFIAFVSTSSNMVPGQSATDPFQANLFLFDREAGSNRMISRPVGTTVGARYSFGSLLSADGSFVAYTSIASDLVPGVVDSNQGDDVFRYSRSTETNTLLSGRAPDLPALTPPLRSSCSPMLRWSARTAVSWSMRARRGCCFPVTSMRTMIRTSSCSIGSRGGRSW